MTGDQLRRIRRRLRLTQAQLAESIGVTPTTLARWERDEVGISEVAARLSYSERTIKAVMHDVTTKLHAKTRSQAVAQAVREGLI